MFKTERASDVKDSRHSMSPISHIIFFWREMKLQIIVVSYLSC